MVAQLQLQLNSSLYLRDPQSSDLGQRIVNQSIHLIDEIGFEAFNFKKLSIRINSTEASIYRYFENKHRLLIYLIAWYWTYLEYKITYETHNISDPRDKLRIAIGFITHKLEDDDNFSIISESVLQRVVILESDKTYLTKNVDDDNKEGLFKGYKSLCITIARFMQEINPDFPYPHSLTSTCLEAAHQQIFFAQHLPALTDIKKDDDIYAKNLDFLMSTIFKTLEK
ncbi:MAG: TetR/AcrR family transcriptional regulator [Ekhidna sp.]|uniref:TetR/AcrR family transcriptional regulator n=1 Tax=Ekhidna sp. TaxID=2608089 RepID=UPI0032ECB472